MRFRLRTLLVATLFVAAIAAGIGWWWRQPKPLMSQIIIPNIPVDVTIPPSNTQRYVLVRRLELVDKSGAAVDPMTPIIPIELAYRPGNLGPRSVHEVEVQIIPLNAESEGDAIELLVQATLETPGKQAHLNVYQSRKLLGQLDLKGWDPTACTVFDPPWPGDHGRIVCLYTCPPRNGVPPQGYYEVWIVERSDSETETREEAER